MGQWLEVGAYAKAMKAQLDKHAPERGKSWKEYSAIDLFKHLKEEVKELKRLLYGKEYPLTIATKQRILEEAADIGNMAMMIADVCGAIRTGKPQLILRCTICNVSGNYNDYGVSSDNIVIWTCRSCKLLSAVNKAVVQEYTP